MTSVLRTTVMEDIVKVVTVVDTIAAAALLVVPPITIIAAVVDLELVVGIDSLGTAATALELGEGTSLVTVEGRSSSSLAVVAYCRRVVVDLGMGVVADQIGLVVEIDAEEEIGSVVGIDLVVGTGLAVGKNLLEESVPSCQVAADQEVELHLAPEGSLRQAIAPEEVASGIDAEVDTENWDHTLKPC